MRMLPALALRWTFASLLFALPAAAEPIEVDNGQEQGQAGAVLTGTSPTKTKTSDTGKQSLHRTLQLPGATKAEATLKCPPIGWPPKFKPGYGYFSIDPGWGCWYSNNGMSGPPPYQPGTESEYLAPPECGGGVLRGGYSRGGYWYPESQHGQFESPTCTDAALAIPCTKEAYLKEYLASGETSYPFSCGAYWSQKKGGYVLPAGVISGPVTLPPRPTPPPTPTTPPINANGTKDCGMMLLKSAQGPGECNQTNRDDLISRCCPNGTNIASCTVYGSNAGAGQDVRIAGADCDKITTPLKQPARYLGKSQSLGPVWVPSTMVHSVGLGLEAPVGSQCFGDNVYYSNGSGHATEQDGAFEKCNENECYEVDKYVQPCE